MSKSKLNEVAYTEGRDQFDAGTSLKEMVKPILDHGTHIERDEDVIMSRMIGYLDGVVATIRALARRP